MSLRGVQRRSNLKARLPRPLGSQWHLFCDPECKLFHALGNKIHGCSSLFSIAPYYYWEHEIVCIRNCKRLSLRAQRAWQSRSEIASSLHSSQWQTGASANYNMLSLIIHYNLNFYWVKINPITECIKLICWELWKTTLRSPDYTDLKKGLHEFFFFFNTFLICVIASQSV